MVAVSLKPIDEDGVQQVFEWLSKPGAAARWGSYSVAEAEIRKLLTSPSALARTIVDESGTGVGFAYAVDAQVWGHTLPDGLPKGTWEVDLFSFQSGKSGDIVELSAWPLFVDDVLANTPATALAAFIDVLDEPALEVLEQRGFLWDHVDDHPTRGRSWFMVAPRT